MNEFHLFNAGQHLASKGRHFVVYQRAEMNAGVGDYDALSPPVGSG